MNRQNANPGSLSLNSITQQRAVASRGFASLAKAGTSKAPAEGGSMIDAEYVLYRLEEAGKTLMSLPGRPGHKALGAQTYGYVAEAVEASGFVAGRIRLSPSRAEIDRMDEAMPWLSLINNRVQRRIVAARSLVHPINDRHLVSWAKVGLMVGCDYRAVQRWHAEGIDALVSTLRRQESSGHKRLCLSS